VFKNRKENSENGIIRVFESQKVMNIEIISETSTYLIP